MLLHREKSMAPKVGAPSRYLFINSSRASVPVSPESRALILVFTQADTIQYKVSHRVFLYYTGEKRCFLDVFFRVGARERKRENQLCFF